MADGQQFTGTPGTPGSASLVRLRSRKVGSGTAVMELSGQQYAALQGVFGKTRAKALAGSVLTHLLGTVTASGTTQPPSPPVDISDIAQLDENFRDGPNNTYAGLGLAIEWDNYQGDWIAANGAPQGAAYFARHTRNSVTVGEAVVWTITTLIQKLMTDGNTGIYVRATSGSGTNFSTRENANPALRPKFTIVTTAGTFERTALKDIWLTDNSNSSGELLEMRASPAFIVKPDLTGLTGTVTSATMTLYTQSGTQGLPCVLDCFYLKMPTIISDPVRQVGNVVQGIAAAGANDLALANHPSVWFYPRMDSEANIRADWDLISPWFALNPSYVSWPQYGLTAFRLSSPDPSSPDPSSMLTWHHIPPPNCKEMYIRYLWYIDPDYAVGVSSEGMKMPGFGSFPGSNGDFSYRMSLLNPTPANPFKYAFALHAFDTDNNFLSAGAQNRYTSVHLKTGHIFSIEQYVKMNTKIGGAWAANGITRIWIDGVLSYEDTARRINGTDGIEGENITDFFCNVYHGGQPSPPFARFHFELGGVCMATQYIGPPKVVTGGLPAWRPPEGFFADIPTVNGPADVFPPLYGAGWSQQFTHWAGGAVLRDYSPLGAMGLFSGGHETAWDQIHVQGSLTFDFSTLAWEYHNQPTTPGGNKPGTAAFPHLYSNVDIFGEFPDGSIYNVHSYQGLQEMRTAWGGGPKGSIVSFEMPNDVTPTRPGLNSRTAHKIDVSQATLGFSRLFTNREIRAPLTVRDDARQGWWVNGVAEFTGTYAFVSKTGAIGPSYAHSTGLAQEPGLAYWPERDLLIYIGGGYYTGNLANTGHRTLYILKLGEGGVQQNGTTQGRPPARTQGFGGAWEVVGTPTIFNGGSGYAVGNTLTFTEGDAGAGSGLILKVTSVGGGGVITGIGFADQAYPGYTLPERGWYHTESWNLTQPGGLSVELACVSGTANTLRAQAGTAAKLDETLVGGSIIITRGPGSGSATYAITAWNASTETVTVAPNFLATPTFWNGSAGNLFRIQKPPFSQRSTSGSGTGARFQAVYDGARDMYRLLFIGLHWCSKLNCIIGYDHVDNEIVMLTPPSLTGDVFNIPWTWSRVSVAHWAADTGGRTTLNPGVNGLYGKFQYVDSLKALVLFSSHPPQIITLPGMN